VVEPLPSGQDHAAQSGGGAREAVAPRHVVGHVVRDGGDLGAARRGALERGSGPYSAERGPQRVLVESADFF
jgi:hypothetical protein